jgi:ribonuclease Z
LGNETANVTKIFITHGHGDHALGLISIIGARNNAHGMSRNPDTQSHNKSLEIFYPRNAVGMDKIIEFVEERCKGWLRYNLKWIYIDAGAQIDLGFNTHVEAFEMLHTPRDPTLGYVIKENRKRLRSEFVGLNIREILASGKVNKDQLNEEYSFNLFAYCLDAYQINANLWDCEHVVMDCTFLDKDDRTDITHFTFDESLEYCRIHNIKNMYAAHVSSRYDKTNNVPISVEENGTTVHWINNMKPNLI